MRSSTKDRPAAVVAAAWLERHAAIVLVASVLVTAAFSVPLVFMQPTATASQEPTGPIFDAQQLVDDRFASDTHRAVFIVEGRSGNVLSKLSLAELLGNVQAARRDEAVGPKLRPAAGPSQAGEVLGSFTVADAVDGILRQSGEGGLEQSSEDVVAESVSRLLDAAPPSSFFLSADASRDDSTGRWSAAAMILPVLSDNEALGGGGQSTMLGTDDTTKEEHARRIQTLLRGEERHIRVWGLAIDVNLTSAEQGATAGPYIGATILVVLLLVGFIFRSYWAVAVVGFALGALVVWLQGLSNLVGLRGDQILSIIVPIAMISFGVDNTFHAFGRCREEAAGGVLRPRAAFVAGLGGVLGALLVALGSDAAAFLANASSGIESLFQFAVATPMALGAAFVMLGIVTPLALSVIEERLGPSRRGGKKARTLFAAVASFGAAAAATAAVLVVLFFDPLWGAGLLAGFLAAFIMIPGLLASVVQGRKRAARDASLGAAHAEPGKEEASAGRGEAGARTRSAALMGRVVVAVARRRAVVLPVVAVITAVCGYFASRVEPRFDVRDFFDPDSDFVVSLERFEHHVADRGGEPATIYVEGDFTNPAAIGALRRFVDELRALQGDSLARDRDGAVEVKSGVLEIVDGVLGSPPAREALAARLGAPLSAPGEGALSAAELGALFEFAGEVGVAGAGPRPISTVDDVSRALWRSPDGRLWATHFDVRVPGSGDQRNVEAARDALVGPVERLHSALAALDGGGRAVLTGQTMRRLATLEAVFQAFQRSLPLAVALCLLVALAAMRSLRLALVSVVPVLLVVVWLYAFMYIIGQNVNVVTATIGAISVGIGIDFAIHLIMRFREELEVLPPEQALEAAGGGTGMALAASALSSIVGFAILAFAPMPMFAAYGLLTAVMIFLAVAASLLVLPSLLLIITSERP